MRGSGDGDRTANHPIARVTSRFGSERAVVDRRAMLDEIRRKQKMSERCSSMLLQWKGTINKKNPEVNANQMSFDWRSEVRGIGIMEVNIPARPRPQ